MSYGNKMANPFSDPNLVATAINHNDNQTRGYVWGTGGSTHYCFLDPDKVSFDIWTKEFQWRQLSWMIPNITAALATFWWNMPLAASLFFSIPTFPKAFLRHYRETAIRQPAAVVSNGPQMEYPGRLSTMGIAIAMGSLAAIGGAAGLFLSGKIGIPAGGVPIGIAGKTLSVGFVKFLLTVGSAVNVGALMLWLLAHLSVPFGEVRRPGLFVKGKGHGGWYHLGRSSTPFETYRIGPEQPVGLDFGCGGLIPIIRAGSPSRKEETRNVLRNQLDLVVWGLIPFQGDSFWSKFEWDDLSEDDKKKRRELGWDKSRWDNDQPPPSGSKSWSELSDTERDTAKNLGYDKQSWNGEEKKRKRMPLSDDYWNRFDWDELSDEDQEHWSRLGWDKELWDSDSEVPSGNKKWDDLTDDERDAAENLGYDLHRWEGIPVEGMLIVVGDPNFGSGHVANLVTHGCIDAVATDGRLSPLLGTRGDLAMETNFALDPIQRYGFMCR